MDIFKKFQLQVAELMANIKSWNFNLSDYRITKKEADTIMWMNKVLQQTDYRVVEDALKAIERKENENK